MSRIRQRLGGRFAAAAVFYGVARQLPWSPRPGGELARRFRGRLARRMLDSCGDDVNVEHGARFGSGKGLELGDRSALGLDVIVIGPLTIGADVMMGPRCMLISSNHETGSVHVPMNAQGFAPDRRIVIEDDVWLGAAVIVLSGVRIGRGSVVAAGAVVTKDVPAWSIVGGNPATVLRSRRLGDAAEDGSTSERSSDHKTVARRP